MPAFFCGSISKPSALENSLAYLGKNNIALTNTISVPGVERSHCTKTVFVGGGEFLRNVRDTLKNQTRFIKNRLSATENLILD